jgi:hypothetical protein
MRTLEGNDTRTLDGAEFGKQRSKGYHQSYYRTVAVAHQEASLLVLGCSKPILLLLMRNYREVVQIYGRHNEWNKRILNSLTAISLFTQWLTCLWFLAFENTAKLALRNASSTAGSNISIIVKAI